MPAPQISNKLVSFSGKKLKSLTVAFEDPDRRILVVDSAFNLNEDSKNTFVNLCYQCCKATKQGHKFTYIEAAGLDHDETTKLAVQYRADALVFVDDQPARRFLSTHVKQFGLLLEHEHFQTILSTPFFKWSSSQGFSKGEAGKNLLGFNLKHMLSAVRGQNPFKPVDPSELDFPIRMVDTIGKFKKFMEFLQTQKLVCIDTEGASLYRITNTNYTIQFGFKTKDGYVVYILPWQHKEATWSEQEFRTIRKALRNYFIVTQALLVFHNAKFDILQLMQMLSLPLFLPRVWDTMNSQFAIDENYKFIGKVYQIGKPYSLEIIEGWFNIPRPKGVIAKEDRSNMSRFSLHDMSEYGAYDVVTPLIIRGRHRQAATDKYVGYKSVEDYDNLVIDQLGVMSKTFALLEHNGVRIDVDNARELTKPDSVFAKELKRIKAELLETPAGRKTQRILQKKQGLSASGGIFSTQASDVLELTKPAHLRTLFFDVLKLEPVKQGKSGEPSTDKAFQKRYAKSVKEVKLYSDYNKVKTLKLNFADSIVRLTAHDNDFKATQRLRSNYGHVGVLTGRPSSNEPNLQNIPARSDGDYELGKELVKGIKANFTVAHGRVMVAADFSAHEVRIGGVITKDEEIEKVFVMANMAIINYRLSPVAVIDAAIKVLAREGDIHISNVRFFFNQEVDKSHVLRYRIKAIVFGTIYGKMAKGLAKELGITEEEAQALIDVLFERWSGMSTWIEETHALGKKTFMYHYPNKRIRHLWGYIDEDKWTHHAMDRRIVNSPLQGFASDISIASIYESAKWKFENITRKGYDLDMLHTNLVHDAQYLDVLYEHMPFAVYLCEHSMSTLPMNYYKDKFDYDINIPLSFGMEFGPKWSKLEEWSQRAEGHKQTITDKEGKQKEIYVSGLYDILRDLGKGMDKDYDLVIEDAKYMTKIRHKELRTDPYKMLVNGNNINKLFDNLHMFRSQKEYA